MNELIDRLMLVTESNYKGMSAILRVYRDIDGGRTPSVEDLDEGLLTMFEYYSDSVKWFDEHEYDPLGEGWFITREDDERIRIDWRKRLSEIQSAIKSESDPRKKMKALDRAVNQFHSDQPMLMHFVMGSGGKGWVKYESVVREIIDLLQKMGKIKDRSGGKWEY